MDEGGRRLPSDPRVSQQLFHGSEQQHHSNAASIDPLFLFLPLSQVSLSRQIFPGLSERDLRAEVDTDNLFDVPIGTRVRPEKRAGWQPPTSLPQMVKPGSGKWFNGCTAAGQ